MKQEKKLTKNQLKLKNGEQNREDRKLIENLNKPFFIASFPFIGYLCSYLYQLGIYEDYNLPYIYVKVTLESAVISSLIIGLIAVIIFITWVRISRYKRAYKIYKYSLVISLIILIVLRLPIPKSLTFWLVLILIPILITAGIRIIRLGYFAFEYLKQKVQKKQGIKIRIDEVSKIGIKKVDIPTNILFTILFRHPLWIFEGYEPGKIVKDFKVRLKNLFELDLEILKDDKYKPYYLFFILIIVSALASLFIGYHDANNTANYLVTDPKRCSDQGKSIEKGTPPPVCIQAVISEYNNYFLSEEIQEKVQIEKIHNKRTKMNSYTATKKIIFIPINEKTILQVKNLTFDNKADDLFTTFYAQVSLYYRIILNWYRDIKN